METKKCTKCKEEKSLSFFSQNPNSRSKWCKPCCNRHARENRAAESPEKKEARLKRTRKWKNAWYKNASPAQRARISEGGKKWRIENADHVKEYRVKNRPRRIKQMKDWRGVNATHVTEYQKEYRSKPEKKALRCALQQKREALKKDAVLPDTNFEIIEQLYQARRIISQETGIPHEVDHIIPISLGGAHHQDNLDIVTEKENGAKSSIWDPEKYPKQLTGKWANNELAKKNKKEFGIE